MWEGACPRWRWVSQHLCQPCRRLRSLAKARHLPQGIGGIHEIYSRATLYLPPAIQCGRGLAPDGGGSANIFANRAAVFEASLKLDISHRGLVYPCDLPPGCFLPANSDPVWEGACPRWRCVSQPLCQQCRRLRSLAKARHLPQGIGGIREIYRRAAFYLPTAIQCGRGLAPDGGGSVTLFSG
ncbi:hypothetical protein FX985_02338 [Pseudomonas extremaustralis]|uniref:Uncharacterized protein n=1 Tax=Pseudomonas extremaustralis TaxID=359110 RepID=A0A5M9J2D6_9PSED|nr:hypothetical protein FX985_02338 [Pseudomonas extremaustralis]